MKNTEKSASFFKKLYYDASFIVKECSGNPFLKDCDQPTEKAYRNGVHEYLGKETA